MSLRRIGALAALALIAAVAIAATRHGAPSRHVAAAPVPRGAPAPASGPSGAGPHARVGHSRVTRPQPRRSAAPRAGRERPGPVARGPVSRPSPFRPGVVLLGFRPGTSPALRREVEAAAGVTETRTLGSVHVVRTRGRSVRQAVRALLEHPSVRYAEPDYLMHASAVPDDPAFGGQWGLQNTGQPVPLQDASEAQPTTSAVGTAGADAGASAAWNVTTGSRSIVVGEVDTGVDYTHPDLAANVWSNPGGIGGCRAGTHGYDVLDGACDPMDDDSYYGGHGTHVAGIIGAVGDNAIGVAGVNWRTTILPVKWLDSNASGDVAGLIAALEWLRQARLAGVNVRVINDSATFVGWQPSQALANEIGALDRAGILFVTAAGNTGDDNDDPAQQRYPCAYSTQEPNELCVTATDDRDRLPGWAGYGATTVDLAAPGTSIYSTLRKGGYGYLTGGSMSSAMVSGAAALVLSATDLATPELLKARLLAGVDRLPSLAGKVLTAGRLDLCRALPGCGPPIARTLAATAIGPSTATLAGDVNPQAHATVYDFQYGPTTAYGSTTPVAGGASLTDIADHPVSRGISGLAPRTTYHFRVVATSAAGSVAGPDQTFVTQPAGSGPAPGGGRGAILPVASSSAKSRVALGRGGRVRADARGRFTIPGGRLACAAAWCKFTVVVTWTPRVWARSRRILKAPPLLALAVLFPPPDRPGPITVRLTRGGLRLLRTKRSLTATVTAGGRDATRALGWKTEEFMLVAPRAKPAKRARAPHRSPRRR